MLFTNYIEILLGLKGVIIKNITQTEKITSIDIEMKLKPHNCPCCGTETRTIHDYRWQKIKDIPAFGKHVILHLRKRRYRCSHCGKRFYEDNDFLPKYHRMTSRLCAYIIQILSDVRSFSSSLI